MSWDSFSRSLSAIIDERLSNPLITSFLLSWPVWNYRFIVILLSENTVTETFRLIETAAYPECWGFPYWFTVVGPVATAYAYVYLLPYATNHYFKKWRKNLQAYNEIKEVLPIEPMLSKAEGLELEKQFFELQTTIGQLRIDNRVLQNEVYAATQKAERFDRVKAELEATAQENASLKSRAASERSRMNQLGQQVRVLRESSHMTDVKYHTLKAFIESGNPGVGQALQAIETHTMGITPDGISRVQTFVVDNINLSQVMRNYSSRLKEISDAGDPEQE